MAVTSRDAEAAALNQGRQATLGEVVVVAGVVQQLDGSSERSPGEPIAEVGQIVEQASGVDRKDNEVAFGGEQ